MCVCVTIGDQLTDPKHRPHVVEIGTLRVCLYLKFNFLVLTAREEMHIKISLFSFNIMRGKKKVSYMS